MSPKLSDFIGTEEVLFDLVSTTKPGVLRELADYAVNKGFATDGEALLRGLEKRESLISTGIGDGVAIPHTRCPGVERVHLLIARSREGVDFDSLDGEPAYLFVTLIGPEDSGDEQLKILSRTARLLKQGEFRERLLNIESQEEALNFIRREETWW
jgi:fructose-specific phosphotransferase system IIA component